MFYQIENISMDVSLGPVHASSLVLYTREDFQQPADGRGLVRIPLTVMLAAMGEIFLSTA